ncbi:NUDIX hydrolase [Roseateles sp. DAIF2]|uniref:NUDIX hydrolase n=1 Tax=Roseateles sp. DAIF2 TaxID=2714952 RepID=UPI0018A252CB|nr:NUDIX hydrolase [Roseateles sp. DAIF2]QPF76024.1 NUDIX hydrolase [Roseateles sp. DAIF2]
MSDPQASRPFKPSVTVAAVIERAGRYLLVEEETAEGLRLNNPAGHLEQGETPLQGAVREALEETAHRFRPEALLGFYMSRFQRAARGEDVTYLRIAYCGGIEGEGPLPGLTLDQGILRCLWLSPAEIAAARDAGRLRSPLVWRCLEDHLAGRRLPLDLVQADDSLFVPERRP